MPVDEAEAFESMVCEIKVKIQILIVMEGATWLSKGIAQSAQTRLETDMMTQPSANQALQRNRSDLTHLFDLDIFDEFCTPKAQLQRK